MGSLHASQKWSFSEKKKFCIQLSKYIYDVNYYQKHRKNIFCNLTIFELVNEIGDFESLWRWGCKKIGEFICFSNQYSRRIPFEIWRWQLLKFFDRKSRRFRVVLTWCLQNSRNRQICPRLLRNAFLSRGLSCFCCHFGCGFSSLIIHNYKSHFTLPRKNLLSQIYWGA